MRGFASGRLSTGAQASFDQLAGVADDQIRFPDLPFGRFFWRKPAGLGLVDTLPREGRAPQGGVEDTWIFPPTSFIISNVSCQALQVFTSYC